MMYMLYYINNLPIYQLIIEYNIGEDFSKKDRKNN